MLEEYKYALEQRISACGISGTVRSLMTYTNIQQRIYTVRTDDGQTLYMPETVIDALISAQHRLDHYARPQLVAA